MDNISDVIRKAQMQQRGRIFNSFSNKEQVTVDPNNLSKGEEIDEVDANPFNKEAEEIAKAEAEGELEEEVESDEVEKSDILNAVSNYSNPIRFSKTGKEIKENLVTVLAQKEAALEAVKKEADDALEDCGAAPTCNVPCWWTGELKIEVPYKYYDWSQTYYEEKKNTNFMFSSLSPEQQKEKEEKVNAPQSEAQAEARRLYNEKVRAIAEITTDIEAIGILNKNLKDGSNYNLDPRQIIAFGFK